MLFQRIERKKQIELFRGAICENVNHSRKICDFPEKHVTKDPDTNERMCDIHGLPHNPIDDTLCDWNETHVGLLQHETNLDNIYVELLPKKILRLRNETTHESAVHYDTWGFFQASLLKALEQWHIPIPLIVEQGKLHRDEFPKDFDVELYNLTETRLHLQLMEALRSKLVQVGLEDISGWHGAGAIAALMLKNFNANYYAGLPPAKNPNFKGFEYQSYYGGRIELFQRGLIRKVYNYDINSAYPSAMRELPNLHGAKWRYVHGEQALNYDFGVVKVKWEPKNGNRQLGAFPYRLEQVDGRKRRIIIYPIRGVGYYHLVEVKAAISRNLWNIEVLNGCVLPDVPPIRERPFYAPIDEIMKRRLAFKAVKDMAHIPLKLGANSFYGKFAQRDKDRREFGNYANYWYAGFITAWTRAELLKYVNPSSVILCATDGLYSTEPLKCPIGGNLGEWEAEEFEEGCFILPGIYRVNKTYKTRGFPKMDDSAMSNLFTRVLNGEKPKFEQKLFVGVRKSLKQYRKYPKAGFYSIVKKLDWNSVEDKRHFAHNNYSEPRIAIDPKDERNPNFLGQKESSGFRPWSDGKNDYSDYENDDNDN